MQVVLAVLSLALLNLVLGTAFGFLWNLGAGSLASLPSISWLEGVAIYLTIRLIVSPPKLSFDFTNQ